MGACLCVAQAGLGVLAGTLELAQPGDEIGAAGLDAWPVGLYSKLPKKNSLFFRIGPPILPPKRLLSKRGFFGVSPGAVLRATTASMAFRLRF